uniref:Uncharacterized protein n=1 Tax=Brassica oleracea var. oleracea TaxID=109376 RepID=A0A0D3DBP4_BRAOL
MTSISSTLQLSWRRESTSSSVSCNLLTPSSWYFFLSLPKTRFDAMQINLIFHFMFAGRQVPGMLQHNNCVQPLSNSCSVWKLSDCSVPAHRW